MRSFHGYCLIFYMVFLRFRIEVLGLLLVISLRWISQKLYNARQNFARVFRKSNYWWTNYLNECSVFFSSLSEKWKCVLIEANKYFPETYLNWFMILFGFSRIKIKNTFGQILYWSDPTHIDYHYPHIVWQWSSFLTSLLSTWKFLNVFVGRSLTRVRCLNLYQKPQHSIYPFFWP